VKNPGHQKIFMDMVTKKPGQSPSSAYAIEAVETSIIIKYEMTTILAKAKAKVSSTRTLPVTTLEATGHIDH
jgi:hypothetical protein